MALVALTRPSQPSLTCAEPTATRVRADRRTASRTSACPVSRKTAAGAPSVPASRRAAGGRRSRPKPYKWARGALRRHPSRSRDSRGTASPANLLVTTASQGSRRWTSSVPYARPADRSSARTATGSGRAAQADSLLGQTYALWPRPVPSGRVERAGPGSAGGGTACAHRRFGSNCACGRNGDQVHVVGTKLAAQLHCRAGARLVDRARGRALRPLLMAGDMRPCVTSLRLSPPP